ncbi:phage tail sheath C-terminal domain-containing protein [uncultured Oscillibacter sp.]|uniref:phage tail sheath C-terminal domain-containing protein n=1 Tax=uncultured Oscillibacter sp. TaxID=876091 RepID=UPI0025FB3CCA|nr:phage tail sheath C-terminal domain-containing protein [uncultured Oscillibacter sp.]
MSKLTMPTLTVAFRERANTAAARSRKGTVAFLIRDAAADEEALTYTLTSTAQIPKTLGTANQASVRRVFLGNGNPPRKVLLYVMGAADTLTADSAALTWLATQKFDYLAGPDDLTAAEAAVVKTWIVNQRSDNHAVYKAVLPNLAADSEAVVNFAADGILADGATYDAAGYCGRIAGLIAGTPMTQSVTYVALPEVTDIRRMTLAEMDEAVGAGKLILYHDGEKVKLGRGVNALTTVTGKSEVWKKIKIVELLDMMQQDIRLTIQDQYIGKVSNSYDNKLQLVTAVSVYLQALAKDGLIEADFTVGIDVDAQDAWLQEAGVPTAEMSEQEVKEANTGTHVFLQLFVTPIDAMEDVAVQIDL